MKPFAAMLAGGDRRSIGAADAVLRSLERDPSRFEELWECLAYQDALVRMRAADALEKFSRTHAKHFARYKCELLAGTLDDGTPEVRWHLIAITARLELTSTEAKKFCAHLLTLVRNDRSRIVKVMALQAAADLASTHKTVAVEFQEILVFARSSPWPSLRGRAARLLRGEPAASDT